jgi:hypothetical protein
MNTDRGLDSTVFKAESVFIRGFISDVHRLSIEKAIALSDPAWALHQRLGVAYDHDR